MKIIVNKKPKEVIDNIKKILDDVKISFTSNKILINNFEYGKIYDKLPLIENIKGVERIILKNEELMPLVYSYRERINKKIITAGPCVIDDWDIFIKTAKELEKLNITAIRTPLFKPRSLPYGWEGHGISGIKKLAEIKKEIKTPFIMEILDPHVIERVYDIVEIIQIGARNMKNYVLLKEAAKTKRTILLKRQPHATIREFLYSCEYLLKYGSQKIILCERGDNISDGISSINIKLIKDIKKQIKIPIIADISHSAKKREKVFDFAKKIKNIADGIMVETSICPDKSTIDTKQIIDINEFKKILKLIR